jgi:hypothetical protein
MIKIFYEIIAQIYPSSALQTKNPTNVGLDVVKRVKLFQQYHLLYLPEISCLYFV